MSRTNTRFQGRIQSDFRGWLGETTPQFDTHGIMIVDIRSRNEIQDKPQISSGGKCASQSRKKGKSASRGIQRDRHGFLDPDECSPPRFETLQLDIPS
jgi:hypothetical protein